MPKKITLILVLFLGFLYNLQAINTITPSELKEFSSDAVYSIVRDSRGAIWFSTSKGLYRYNGHKLSYLETEMTKKGLSVGADHVFVQAIKGIKKFNINSFESVDVKYEGIDINADVIASDADVLYAVLDSMVFYAPANKFERMTALPEGVKVTCLNVLPDHKLLASTADSGMYVIDPGKKTTTQVAEKAGITATISTEDGGIWVSDVDGVLRLYDTSCWSILKEIEFEDKTISQSIRTLALDNKGNIYAGSAQGLYRIDKNASIGIEAVGNILYCPVCCLLNDSDSNLWIGTYYGGIQLSCPTIFHDELPFENGSILSVSGIVEESDASIYIFTDGCGIWKYDSSVSKKFLIPGSMGIKFQSTYKDPATGLIWSGDYHGILYSFNPLSQKLKHFNLSSHNITIIHSVFRKENEFLLGCEEGLFTANPSSPESTLKKIEGTESCIFIVEKGPDGTIWAAGDGLFTLCPDNTIRPFQFKDKTYSWVHKSSINDMAFDKDGRLWLAFTKKGVLLIDKENVRSFTKENSGLLDNYTYNIIPKNNGTAITGTASGISVINGFEDSPCTNFPSIVGHSLAELSDGRILIAGKNGISSLENSGDIDRTVSHPISIDLFFANGILSKSHTLDHTKRSFEFGVTTFDYSETVANSFFCRLDGFDKDWIQFDPNKNVAYMNMKPQKYRFNVEMRSYSGVVLSRDSMDIRIKPAWYATLMAKIAIFVLVFCSAGYFLYSRYSRKKLTEELERREREFKERTAFFINLSYKLRTPLNLVIGNLERFFHDFGSRTAGIEIIEDIYSKIKNMRFLISEYVDTQNEAIEQESDSPQAHNAVKDAKFVNSAIGAVERNLFSPDLNVPLLCKEMNIGKTTLSDRMREATGMSPREFIEDIKLRTAAQMLLEKNLRISEISDLLNFSSPKYFSQRFSLKFGVKPKDYAK